VPIFIGRGAPDIVDQDMQRPATLQFKTADRYQLRDGLFFEHWDVVDRLDASLAMGLIRPASAAGNTRVD
jgi:hypothetical protein